MLTWKFLLRYTFMSGRPGTYDRYFTINPQTGAVTHTAAVDRAVTREFEIVVKVSYISKIICWIFTSRIFICLCIYLSMLFISLIICYSGWGGEWGQTVRYSQTCDQCPGRGLLPSGSGSVILHRKRGRECCSGYTCIWWLPSTQTHYPHRHGPWSGTSLTLVQYCSSFRSSLEVRLTPFITVSDQADTFRVLWTVNNSLNFSSRLLILINGMT